ncbi:hypothetical protein PMAA_011160 [Talaromyces marneffei ATCC 18224]|uniref:Uncharacterized protein n=1 Tax=Talaromyces marneffei (strain ATCC 18224 / CBS 334.59 / QM 7333) TaxID=441960 RepID=B6QUX4_TALMQ|nr:hypothetical protein PMAA_011160 [Talaromyces marneffei ATCC 18224]
MGVRVFAPASIATVITTSDYVNKSETTSFTFTSATSDIRHRPTWPEAAMLSGAFQGLASGLTAELAGPYSREFGESWACWDRACQWTASRGIGEGQRVSFDEESRQGGRFYGCLG